MFRHNNSIFRECVPGLKPSTYYKLYYIYEFKNFQCMLIIIPFSTSMWIFEYIIDNGRSQWPCGLRRRSTAARLLRSWVRIPPEAWMSVCCECCVLSGTGLCDELITRPEESYRLWCVVVYDLENQTSWMRRPRPTRGLSRQENKSCLIAILGPAQHPSHWAQLYFPWG